MSVLLNITMPKTCEVCPCNDDNWRCGATKEYFDYDDMCERRRADCPLIEVPTPHGRLIDADEFKGYIRSGYEEMKHLFNENLKAATLVTEGFCKDIDEAPTVIEAED